MKNILELLDQAMLASQRSPSEFSHVYSELDQALSMEGKDPSVRDFFDCWSDAQNHNYDPYNEKDSVVWFDAAKEIVAWYKNSDAKLSERELWKETIRRGA